MLRSWLRNYIFLLFILLRAFKTITFIKFHTCWSIWLVTLRIRWTSSSTQVYIYFEILFKISLWWWQFLRIILLVKRLITYRQTGHLWKCSRNFLDFFFNLRLSPQPVLFFVVNFLYFKLIINQDSFVKLFKIIVVFFLYFFLFFRLLKCC